MYDFHHQLLRLDGVNHVLPQCLGLDRIGKRFGNLVVHVGIEQSPTHILKGFSHIYLGNLALAFEYFKTPLKFLA